MKTLSKVVGNVKVFACQIQEDMVSCSAQYDTPFTSKNDFKEVIFKTNNVELALKKYIELYIKKSGEK